MRALGNMVSSPADAVQDADSGPKGGETLPRSDI